MRKHRAEGDVTDALDALHAGVELVVDDDAAAVVELDAGSLEVEAFGVGAAANSDQDDVCLKLKGLHETPR